MPPPSIDAVDIGAVALPEPPSSSLSVLHPSPETAVADSAIAPPDPEPDTVTVATTTPIHRTGEAQTPDLAPKAEVEAVVADATPAPLGTPTHRITVKSGDSLYYIFKRLGLSQGDLALITASPPLKRKLARLAPRQKIEFYVDDASRLVRLVYWPDRLRSLHVVRDGDTFTSEEVIASPDLAVAAKITDGALPNPEQGTTQPPVPGADVDVKVAVAAKTPTPIGAPTHRITIRRGDSLFRIFKRLGLSQRDLALITASPSLKRKLARLAPRQKVELYVDDASRLVRLVHRPDRLRSLHVVRDGDTFTSEEVIASPDLPVTVAAKITDGTLPNPEQGTIQPPAPGTGVNVKVIVAAKTPTPIGTPTHRTTVKRGDSLSRIFKRLGLSQRDLGLMTNSPPLNKKLVRLTPGQEIEFYVDDTSRLTRLIHRLDPLRSLHVTRDGNTYTFKEIVESPEILVAAATGIIDSSLFEAGQRAGLSNRITMGMTDIFGWDVDFARDTRPGDRFTLLYEEQLKNGKKIGEGPIVAAEFINRGRRIRAARYVDPTGYSSYYTEDGQSLKKAFMRNPVDFMRISSRFNPSRLHPILHRIRAHNGVDYAAPRGTAVKASGDGRITFAGRKGGYGRTIIVQHGSRYTTLYAHLSQFSKGIRTGTHVKQGQVIGSVGSTGLATGPHLHYEFRVRGVHHDPLKVKFQAAAPLKKQYMADFRKQTRAVFASIEALSHVSVATAD